MIDVHQNATLSESFEGDRSRVIGNRCNSTSFASKRDSGCHGNFKICLSHRAANIELKTALTYNDNLSYEKKSEKKIITFTDSAMESIQEAYCSNGTYSCSLTQLAGRQTISNF